MNFSAEWFAYTITWRKLPQFRNFLKYLKIILTLSVMSILKKKITETQYFSALHTLANNNNNRITLNKCNKNKQIERNITELQSNIHGCLISAGV